VVIICSQRWVALLADVLLLVDAVAQVIFGAQPDAGEA
jgi:hypothetical protein